MYGKIFADIFDSSLISDGGWLPTYVFMSMIVLADKGGVVRLDPRALYRRLGLNEAAASFEEFMLATEKLEKADESSNLDAYEGKRILPLSSLDEIEGNRGWLIVNYAHYRDKGGASEMRQREQNAERQRRWRERKNKDLGAKTPKSNVTVTANNVSNAHTDTDTDTDTDITEANASESKLAVSPRCPYDEIIEKYHQLLPSLPQYRKRTTARDAAMRQRWQNGLPDLDAWADFFGYVGESDFLMGRTQPREGQRLFRADLEWLCKQSNYVKILEGKYHG